MSALQRTKPVQGFVIFRNLPLNDLFNPLFKLSIVSCVKC